MRIQDLIIGLIIFTVFMLSILGFAYKLNNDMGVSVDNDTALAFSEFDANAQVTKTNMFGVVTEMQNSSIGGSNVQADSSKTSGDNIVGSGIRVVTIASRSFGILQDLMQVMAKWLDVPPIFIDAFWIIIVVIIIMIFASSVLYNRL
jgi:hypothetical protein